MYKRQASAAVAVALSASMVLGNLQSVSALAETQAEAPEPVSYTHLDVYKRQRQVWIGLEYFCHEGDEYWKMDQQKWVEFASEELVKMGVLELSLIHI